MKPIQFQLPPKGVLTPNGQEYPLNYYYYPIIGKLYVNKTMKYLFEIIGFSGIDNHHVTTPEEACKVALLLKFHLEKSASLPSFLPSFIYLYRSFCFKK